MSMILIADDERDFRDAVADVLTASGHDVQTCGTTEDALAQVRSTPFDIVLADLRMPGAGGLAVLKEARTRLPDSLLIVMTAYGSMDSAIDAIHVGAHDFLAKPVNLEALVRKVETHSAHQRLAVENRFLRRSLDLEGRHKSLVGTSPAIQEVKRLIAKVGPTDTTVLIRGQTGTGKEVVARAIHRESPRRDHPFVAVNCGSIPDTLIESELFGHMRGSFTGADRDKRGLFEVAGKGTVFLDEIGELPLSLQPKLLRVLEAREIMRVGSTRGIRFEARILAATHRDLKKLAEEERFREDLLYRLNVFDLSLPPLHERREDILPIAHHLLEGIGRRLNRLNLTLDVEAGRLLEAQSWPGNVRELSNVLERAVILAETSTITLADLPGLALVGGEPAGDDLKRARAGFEQAHILRVIRKHGGNKKTAALALGIDLSSLYRKLQGGEPEGK